MEVLRDKCMRNGRTFNGCFMTTLEFLESNRTHSMLFIQEVCEQTQNERGWCGV